MLCQVLYLVGKFIRGPLGIRRDSYRAFKYLYSRIACRLQRGNTRPDANNALDLSVRSGPDMLCLIVERTYRIVVIQSPVNIICGRLSESYRWKVQRSRRCRSSSLPNSTTSARFPGAAIVPESEWLTNILVGRADKTWDEVSWFVCIEESSERSYVRHCCGSCSDCSFWKRTSSPCPWLSKAPETISLTAFSRFSASNLALPLTPLNKFPSLLLEMKPSSGNILGAMLRYFDMHVSTSILSDPSMIAMSLDISAPMKRTDILGIHTRQSIWFSSQQIPSELILICEKGPGSVSTPTTKSYNSRCSTNQEEVARKTLLTEVPAIKSK